MPNYYVTMILRTVVSSLTYSVLDLVLKEPVRDYKYNRRRINTFERRGEYDDNKVFLGVGKSVKSPWDSSYQKPVNEHFNDDLYLKERRALREENLALHLDQPNQERNIEVTEKREE